MGRTAERSTTVSTESMVSTGSLARLRPVLLGAALALVAAPLVATSALAAPAAGPVAPVTVVVAADPARSEDPAPYGGLLDAPDPGEEISTEQALEVGMLGLGTLNGIAFGVAVFLSKMRGPSAAATRQALITRTAPGVASEDRRSRRARREAAAGAVGVAGPGPSPISAPLPVVAATAGAPHPQPARLQPQGGDGRGPRLDGPAAAPGAVPVQARAGSGPLPIIPASAVRRHTSA